MAINNHNPEKKAEAVWAIAGGKGGVGRTLLAANLGVLLADAGHSVIVADCDMDGSNLHTELGIKPPDKSMTDYTSGNIQALEEIVTPTAIDGLSLISGAKNGLNSLNYHRSAKSKLILNLHTLECDYLIVDVGGSACFDTVDLFLSADLGILVTTPELSSVELTYRFLKSLFYRQMRNIIGQPKHKDYLDEVMSGRLSNDYLEIVEKVIAKVGDSDSNLEQRLEDELFDLKIKLIVNMARSRRDQLIGVSMAEIVSKYYGLLLDPLGYIPFDSRVPEANQKGNTFVREYKSSDTAAFFNIIQKKLQMSPPGKQEKQLDLIGS